MMYWVLHTSNGVEVGCRKSQSWSVYVRLRHEHESSTEYQTFRTFPTQPRDHDWKLYSSTECALRRW
jgi:hypothetical protein